MKPHSALAMLCMFATCTAAFAATSAMAQPAPVATDAAEPRKGAPHELPPPVRRSDSGRRVDLSDETASGHSEDMHAVARPFVVPAATVRGPVDSRLQAELERESPTPSAKATPQRPPLKSPRREQPNSAAGAFRALLHGPKKPRKFPKCGSCRMVRCNRSRTYCSGHCRQKRKLFFCDSNSVGTPQCTIPNPEIPRTPADFADRDPSDIEDIDTVVVTVEAPYIGCARSGNRHTGCPARGTPVNLPGRGRATILTSICRSEPYVPDCLSPLLPFGVCECFYRAPRGTGFSRSRFRGRRFASRLVRAPCRTTEFVATAGGGGSDGFPAGDGITVLPAGDFTETWWSDITDLAPEAQFEYSLTASTRSTRVTASIRIDEGITLARLEGEGRVLRDGVEIGEDYDYDADPEAEVFDYVEAPVPEDEIERYYSDNFNTVIEG